MKTASLQTKHTFKNRKKPDRKTLQARGFRKPKTTHPETTNNRDSQLRSFVFFKKDNKHF